MDWDHLRYVLALTRAGSLSAAARELDVTHTTVSRRLTALEEELGVRLFDRTPDGFVPTRAGQEMAAVASRVEGEIIEVDRKVLGRDARLTGTVCLTTVDLFAQWWMPVFVRFCERYPGIELDISIDNSVVSLARREADVALRAMNNPGEHLVGRRIGHMNYAVYGASALVEQLGRDTPLEQYPWLTWSDRARATVTQRWMKTHVPNARIVLRTENAGAMLRAVHAGAGVLHVPLYYARKHPDLVQLRPLEQGFGVDLWLLTHPDLRHTARVKAVMEHVGDALSAERDALAGIEV